MSRARRAISAASNLAVDASAPDGRPFAALARMRCPVNLLISDRMCNCTIRSRRTGVSGTPRWRASLAADRPLRLHIGGVRSALFFLYVRKSPTVRSSQGDLEPAGADVPTEDPP